MILGDKPLIYEVVLSQVMGAKWSRALALLLYNEKLGLLQGLVLEVLEERLWHSVTLREANTSSQSTKCNKHVLNECIE
jgi:hypothetical protein